MLNKINHRIAKENFFKNPQLVILAFDHIGLKINLEGRYENDFLLNLKELIREKLPNSNNLSLIDIGANIGNHSIFFSEFFKSIYAFEPNPLTYEILKINSNFIARKKNIYTYKLGLSNREGKALFRINRINVGGSCIINPKEYDQNSNDDIEIPISCADKIEALLEENIGCLKIDVEGHEFETLIGAENIIKKNRPLIFFEQNKSAIINGSSKAINYLEEIGYSFYTFNREFHFGEKKIERFFSLFMNLFFVKDFELKKIKKFSNRHYEMIIALHN